MGIYLNPGNTLFKEALNSMIYVDKSPLISYTNRVLNTKQKNLCVSRPRRFGKSMAADMLTAYYSCGCDSAALFSGLKIEEDSSCKNHLNQHNVIRLDVQRFILNNQKRNVREFLFGGAGLTTTGVRVFYVAASVVAFFIHSGETVKAL